MPLYIDPASLEGQQLTLHAVGADDYAVRVLDHAAGRIMARPKRLPRPRQLSGPSLTLG